MATRRCNEFEEDLSALLDGELPTAREAEVRAHLADCAACARVHADLRSVADRVSTLPRVGAPAELQLSIGRALERRILHGAEHAGARRIVRWMQISSAAAVIALCVVASRWWFFSTNNGPLKVAPPAMETGPAQWRKEPAPGAAPPALSTPLAKSERDNIRRSTGDDAETSPPVAESLGLRSVGPLAGGRETPLNPDAGKPAATALSEKEKPIAARGMVDTATGAKGAAAGPSPSGGSSLNFGRERAVTDAMEGTTRTADADAPRAAGDRDGRVSRVPVVNVVMQTRSDAEFAAAQRIVTAYRHSEGSAIAAKTEYKRDTAPPNGFADEAAPDAKKLRAETGGQTGVPRGEMVEIAANVTDVRRVIDSLERVAPNQVDVSVVAKWSQTLELATVLTTGERSDDEARPAKDERDAEARLDAGRVADAATPTAAGGAVPAAPSTSQPASAKLESEDDPSGGPPAIQPGVDRGGSAGRGGNEPVPTGETASRSGPQSKPHATEPIPRARPADSRPPPAGKRAPAAKEKVGVKASPSAPPPAAAPGSVGAPVASAPAEAPNAAPGAVTGGGARSAKLGAPPGHDKLDASAAPPASVAESPKADDVSPGWTGVAERLHTVEEIGARLRSAAQSALGNIFGKAAEASASKVKARGSPEVRLRIVILPPEPASAPVEK